MVIEKQTTNFAQNLLHLSLQILSINSGSNGNCYYIGNEEEAVLIDAGISCRETEKRLKRQGLSTDKIKAIFISHEHGDHIAGVPGLSKKYRLPVYITNSTRKHANIPIDDDLAYSFVANEPVEVGNLKVTAFSKSHDACDPHSFIIQDRGVNVGVFTDIGHSCINLTRYFTICHAAFLEANYCEDMLENGNYPYHLKKRISGNLGHLSNRQAFELFIKNRGRHLSHLILSHLSKNNNKPQIVEDLFRPHARGTNIIVASRYQETPAYVITQGGLNPGFIREKPIATPKQQLSLF